MGEGKKNVSPFKHREVIFHLVIKHGEKSDRGARS